jgi:putative hydrolase of the HAD superfamily
MHAVSLDMASLVWFFDLDNTLHDASHAIFPAINVNMNTYIAKVFSREGRPSDASAINAARIDYLRRYGATLSGMVRHHQVSEAEFLHEAHQFDDLAAMIRAERGLARLFERLPGRKILLTNAPRRYAHDVVRHLGLHRHFAEHVPIESMRVHGRLHPKPSKRLLRKLLAKEGVAASRCVMVEDTARNLKAAKALGLRTVWVTRYLALSSPSHRKNEYLPQRLTNRPVYVDVKVKSVAEVARRLTRLSRK